MLEIMVIRPRKRAEGAELGVEHRMVVPVASAQACCGAKEADWGSYSVMI